MRELRHPICILKGVLRRVMRIYLRLPPGTFNDRILVSLNYYSTFSRFPNLQNPTRFSEKMQRRKLYDRNPELVTLQDKYKVRKYVADRIGSEVLVPLLQVTDSPDKIEFDKLPDRFVLKANHGCGLNLLIRDKASVNISDTRKIAGEWLLSNHYRKTREWAYRDINPLLLAEAFIDDGRGDTHPADFKISCFDGTPRYLVVFKGRSTANFRAGRFIIENGEAVPTDLTAIVGSDVIPRTEFDPGIPPQTLDAMLRMASVLSEGIDHLRVDFYHAGDRIFFGEMTLYYGSGRTRYEPDSFDTWLGSWWHQPY